MHAQIGDVAPSDPNEINLPLQTQLLQGLRVYSKKLSRLGLRVLLEQREAVLLGDPLQEVFVFEEIGRDGRHDGDCCLFKPKIASIVISND